MRPYSLYHISVLTFCQYHVRCLVKYQNGVILYVVSYLLSEALPVPRSVSGETSNRRLTMYRGSAHGRWIPIRLCRECASLPLLAERSIGRNKNATSFPRGGRISTNRNHDASSLLCKELVCARRFSRWRRGRWDVTKIRTQLPARLQDQLIELQSLAAGSLWDVAKIRLNFPQDC